LERQAPRLPMRAFSASRTPARGRADDFSWPRAQEAPAVVQEGPGYAQEGSGVARADEVIE